MSQNGINDFDVSYSRIVFLEKILCRHENVNSVVRSDDIVFDVSRVKQSDTIRIICLDDYVLSESKAADVLATFSNVNVLYVGGKWNHRSTEANKICSPKGVSIHNAGSINAALFHNTP